MKLEQLILVDETDRAIGTMDKMEVHRRGLLHRAFSIFIFDRNGNMLLQQRADGKYHSPGLWTNACCSHPYPDEPIEIAAARRLKEELGFVTSLEELFSFTYRYTFENGLTEHEYDHVFTGIYDEKIDAEPTEVKAFDYRSIEQIEEDLKHHPEKFTPWFRLAFPRIVHWVKGKFGSAEAPTNTKTI